MLTPAPQPRKMIDVVAAVVLHQGRVLCMQRAASPYPYIAYHWEFPGGKPEAGEQPEAALRRELMEEMDYPVAVGPLVGEVQHHYPDFDIHLRAYLCTAATPHFVRKEHAAHCWLPPQELHTLNWCAADYPLIAQLLRHIG